MREPNTAGTSAEPEARGGVLRGRRRVDGALKLPPLPLVRPGPRSAMFVPIVVLVAILPGLYALRNWDLTPPGPWWGLRGLDVLAGRWLDQVPAADALGPGQEMEAEAYRAVAFQPPLYAWLEAMGLALSHQRAPVATVLPSYLAGVAVVLLIFAHGRLWQGAGLGLAAAVLTGFNRDLLVQMQQATPSTLGLAGMLGALLAYGRWLRAGEAQSRRAGWVLIGGVSLGLAMLSVGVFGLLAVPVVVLHRSLLGPDPWTIRVPGRSRRLRPLRPGVLAALAALGLALAMVLPWYAMMQGRYGAAFLGALWAPPHSGGDGPSGLLPRLVALAPASLALGLFAAIRAGHRVLLRDGDDPTTVGGAFWIAWLAVACLAPAAFPDGPRPVLNLFLLVPLNLLAARAMLDLASRRIPARSLVWLAPTTAIAVAWWASPALRGAFLALARGQGPTASTALGLHLGVDLVVGLAVLTRLLDRWARRRDDRRRLVLGGFLGAVVALTIARGVDEVRFQHEETADLITLRDAILRRDGLRRFNVLAVVGPAPEARFGAPGPDAPAPRPGGRLRFMLRTALPRLPQDDLTRVEDLLKLPEGQRLVILAGSAERLPYAIQSRLGLEAIHPGRSGILDAYATAEEVGHLIR